MTLEILFWILNGSLIYSYLIYPLSMSLAAHFTGKGISLSEEFLPEVSVLLSVHNEAAVIERKIRSVYNSDYPADKLELIVGSDNSNDYTNRILEDLASQYDSLRYVPYRKRRGKPEVINDIRKLAKGTILIITDADLFPERETIRMIVAPFYDPEIGLVDSIIRLPEDDSTAINVQEMTYQYLESRLKENESKLSGCMMGPSGGFYAIRNELYVNVPHNHLVDDFFICMNILLKGYKTAVCRKAPVVSNFSSSLRSEYRRKVRISAGNFQNLSFFSGLLLKPWKRLTFRFISHKVLRWLGPQLYITALILNLIMVKSSFFYFLLFIIQLILILLPTLDLMLQRLKIRLVPLRFLTHFCIMNLALLAGLFKFIRGIKSGIWEPTKRVV